MNVRLNRVSVGLYLVAHILKSIFLLLDIFDDDSMKRCQRRSANALVTVDVYNSLFYSLTGTLTEGIAKQRKVTEKGSKEDHSPTLVSNRDPH